MSWHDFELPSWHEFERMRGELEQARYVAPFFRDDPAEVALAHVDGAVTILDNLPVRPPGRHRSEGRAKRWRR